jgi:hypothetical protein
MKPMKVAAIVAGSLAAAGVAAPASAVSDLAPSSLNGAAETVLTKTTATAEPLADHTLNTEKKGSLLNSVQGTADGLNKQGGPGKLLGGVPVGGPLGA